MNPRKLTKDDLDAIAYFNRIVRNYRGMKMLSENKQDMAKENKFDLLTPKAQATKLCDMVYHSSMGDGWHIFVVSRATQIAKEIMNHTLLFCVPELADKRKKYWDEVIAEIDKIKGE